MNGRCAHPPIARPGAAAGFTLVELLVSVAMVAILSVAMGSAVLIASRAIDSGESSASRAVAAADIVEQIKAELRLATSFAERSPNAVAFTIPDRDGDGVDERIRYAWSGEARTPLTRVYNDGPEEIVANDVRGFGLEYLVQSLDPPPYVPGEGQESAEVLLAGHEDAPGGNLKVFVVKWDEWCAQYFRPALPADATEWTVTRVQFVARRDRNPYDGVISVSITSAGSELTPAYPVLAEARVSESSLPSQMTWVDVPLSNLSGLDPSQGLCLVIAYSSGTGGIAVVQYEDGGKPMTPDTHWTITKSRGFSFTTPNDRQDMLFRIYGTYTTGGASQ